MIKSLKNLFKGSKQQCNIPAVSHSFKVQIKGFGYGMTIALIPCFVAWIVIILYIMQNYQY